MASFSAVMRGKRHRKPIKLPLIGREEQDVDLTILEPLEVLAVLEKSRAFAVERGVPDPTDGNPIYDFAIHVHTLLYSCVDHDSPDDAPRPYFASIDQILNSGGLISQDVIAYVFARYESLVDEMAVRQGDLTQEGFLKLLHETSQGDTLPFSKLRPGTQWSCFRFLAEQHLLALKDKFFSSSGSVTETTSSASEEPKSSNESQPS